MRILIDWLPHSKQRLYLGTWHKAGGSQTLGRPRVRVRTNDLLRQLTCMQKEGRKDRKKISRTKAESILQINSIYC